MLLLRLLIGRFWFCLGLTMVLAGATAATVGYVAEREARTRASVIVVRNPVSKTVNAQPTKKRTVTKARKPARPAATTQQTVAETRRRLAAAAVARESVSAASAPKANAPALAAARSKWRYVMWWGGGALVVGLASVAYSIYERPPKLPASGADELLNDAPPF